MYMFFLFLTYAVMIGAISASLIAMTRGMDGRLWWPIIVPAVFAHSAAMYGYAWVSFVSTEGWWQLYFLTLALLVAGLAFGLSDGSRTRTLFLVLAYFAYLAILVPVGNLFFSGRYGSLSSTGRLVACWPFAVLGNLAFVFLVPCRALRCGRQSGWGLPSLAVGLLLALLVASGTWPVSLAGATQRSAYLVFALAALATVAATFAFCQPMRDRSREDEADVTDAEPKPKEEEVTKQEDAIQEEVRREEAKQEAPRPALPEPTPDSRSAAATSSGDATGEDLFVRARKMPHHEIPDFDCDGPYLALLSRSAETGYAPALAKLGDYAMRRGAWVEAYYWFSRAKQCGMRNLEAPMRTIRMTWAREGFPDQMRNVNKMFTYDAGSVGRALLRLDSGHAAAQARAFLMENHPEFLAERTNLGK